MEKVNLLFFYQLGERLSPLGKMKTEPQNRIEILIAVGVVDSYLRSLLNWTQELRVCRSGAIALLNAIASVQKWSTEVKTQGDWTKPDIATNLMFQNVVDKAKNLETILSEELPILSTYYASQKGIYSTSDLLDQAEKMFPPSVLAKLGESMIQDVKQGGKCLAFDIPTATGFHMLRATEAVLHEYYTFVCVPKTKAKLESWSAYISALYKFSKKVDGNADIKERVKRVIALLQQIKDHDRNLIMHPEVVLNSDEAFALFEITKGAIMAMAEDLPELNGTAIS